MLRDEKGISFNVMNETQAAVYLSTTNNYLRTASYRKNYEKHLSGPNLGKYICLDFIYLTELSTIDMHLRALLLKMCISIEHAIKVKLLSSFENQPLEDGYSMVTQYIQSNPRVTESIEAKADSVFTDGLIEKYFKLCYVFSGHDIHTRILQIDCPIWVLVEILGFGELLGFYDYFSTKYAVQPLEPNVLKPVRSLRNACAHNNCLLYCLEPNKSNTKPPAIISQYVATISSIGKEERQKKLSSRPLFEITCLLYLYEKVVSNNVYHKGIEELKAFTNGRLVKHMDYFSSNQLVTTSFEFLQKLVDNMP